MDYYVWQTHYGDAELKHKCHAAPMIEYDDGYYEIITAMQSPSDVDKIKEPFLARLLKVENHPVWPDFVMPEMGPELVSDRLRAFIESKTPDARFVPVLIKPKRGATPLRAGYNMLVWRKMIDCVDPRQTDSAVDGDVPIYFVLRYSIIPSLLKPNDLIFTTRNRETETIVREDFALEMLEAGFLGLNFRSPGTGKSLSGKPVSSPQTPTWRPSNLVEAVHSKLYDKVSFADALQFLVGKSHPKLKSHLQVADFDSDYRKFKAWFKSLLASDPPKKKINTLYFGLCQPGEWDSGIAIKLTGATGYSPQQGEDDDASEVDYFPNDMQAPSKVLKQMGEFADHVVSSNKKSGDSISSQIYEFVSVAYATILVNRLMSEKAFIQTLSGNTTRYIQVGDVAGEYMLLGAIKDGAWRLRNPSEPKSEFR